MNKKVLVIYYSRTGTTKKIVDAMTVMMDCDVERIQDGINRSGILGYIRSGKEAVTKTMVKIKNPETNPDDYDVVIIATPIWAGTMSSPVRAYLNMYSGKFKKVGFLVTEGGSGELKTFRDMENICGIKPISTLAITGRDIKKSIYIEKLESFVKEIKK